MTTKAEDRRIHTSRTPVKSGAEPEAESVDGSPDNRPSPTDPMPHVSAEDEPKGQPTSDRFHSEQAHRTGKGKH